MAERTVKKGLVYTNDKCVGCNKCISVCSCMGATVADINENGDNIILVDGDKCISCGACFDVCAHGAREYLDDTEEFFAALKKVNGYPFYWHQHFLQIIRRNTKVYLAD